MSLLLWLAHFVGSTVTLAVNLALASALFLLSAHLFTIPQEDAIVPAYILRGVAAIWMWGAIWHYLKHGVLQRPKPVPSKDKAKVTTAQGLLATLGCFAFLAAFVVTGVVVGAWADWAYQGASGDDPTHPAREAFEFGLEGAQRVMDSPGEYVGYAIGLIAVATVLRLLMGILGRRQPAPQTESARASRRRQRRESAATMPRPEPAAVLRGPGPSSAGQVGPTSAPRTSNSGRTIDDPMLGVLRRDDSAGGWRLANPRTDVGSLLIVASGEPTPAQMNMGRSLVQRSFEALLRASEAARPAAQANGVGLPRFTVAESSVGDAKRGHPSVTMRLKCEGDATRIYEVTSTDGMETFRA